MRRAIYEGRPYLSEDSERPGNILLHRITDAGAPTDDTIEIAKGAADLRLRISEAQWQQAIDQPSPDKYCDVVRKILKQSNVEYNIHDVVLTADGAIVDLWFRVPKSLVE